jgi:flagella basal body P-ring formation protein FlgA
VLVLRTASLRGAAVRESDLIRDTRRVPGTSADYVNSTDNLVRHHLRRNLGAGSVLTASDLEGDALVRRGQTVNVIAETAGMRIQSEALAMADAKAGERVRLQNLQTFKLIEGVVDTEGAVRVPL